jgi:hypothetical protein
VPGRAGEPGRLARIADSNGAAVTYDRDSYVGGAGLGVPVAAADRFRTCTGTPRGASRRAIAGRQVPARSPVTLRVPAPAQVRNRPAPPCRRPTAARATAVDEPREG